MKQVVDQLFQLLKQGIEAIFRFVWLIWAWTIDQINQVTQVPFLSWPLWKQFVVVITILAVAAVLFKAAKEFWDASEKILAAFVTLLGVLVRTLPLILAAGLIAMAGLWILNTVKF
jgi:hypothetical protein